MSAHRLGFHHHRGKHRARPGGLWRRVTKSRTQRFTTTVTQSMPRRQTDRQFIDRVDRRRWQAPLEHRLGDCVRALRYRGDDVPQHCRARRAQRACRRLRKPVAMRPRSHREQSVDYHRHTHQSQFSSQLRRVAPSMVARTSGLIPARVFIVVAGAFLSAVIGDAESAAPSARCHEQPGGPAPSVRTSMEQPSPNSGAETMNSRVRGDSVSAAGTVAAAQVTSASKSRSQCGSAVPVAQHFCASRQQGRAGVKPQFDHCAGSAGAQRLERAAYSPGRSPADCVDSFTMKITGGSSPRRSVNCAPADPGAAECRLESGRVRQPAP